jgi:putative tryptophan/tyrosine transport system substrate-binding protein
MRLAPLTAPATLALALLAAPLAAEAQPAAKRRIGVITTGSLATDHQAFREGLRQHGWVEGENVAIEYHSVNGQLDRMAAVADDLVRLGVDVIVASNAAAALAAKRATSRIPIVFILVADPVGDGLVASLAHPGGNLTGLTTLSRELAGKRLQLLTEAISKVSRVALVYSAADPGAAGGIGEYQTAATALGLTLQPFEARRTSDLDGILPAIKRWGAHALAVPPGPFTAANQKKIDALALKLRVPTVYASRSAAVRGGLMAYGPGYTDLYRRAAIYVARILKGAKPSDLPVEQPTKFEFVVNLKTAKALGLTIPPPLLLQTDRVID